MLQNRASYLQVNSFSIRFPFDSTFNEVIEKVDRIFINLDMIFVFSFLVSQCS